MAQMIYSNTPVVYHSKHLVGDLATIFDFLPFGIALFDSNKILVYYNITLRDQLGVTFRESTSEIVLSLSSRSIDTNLKQFKNLRNLLESLKNEGEEQSSEFTYLNKCFWIKAKSIKMNEESKYIVTFSDITNQRKYEVLQEVNKIKSKIISSISHEIRNPLHNILNSLSYLFNTPKSDSSHKNIEIASSNANQILYKIDDLLVQPIIRII